MAEPSTGPLRTGERLADRFVVEHLAASGGMGAVYRGTDLETRLPVAIKVVAKRRRTTNDRFAIEVRLLAELSHPSIVRYVAHGLTPQNEPFLVMEWLHGEDLSTRLAGQGLSVKESLELMRQLCGALDVAHRRGITHRDLKPSNVFLVADSGGSIKLLDFGIARQDAPHGAITRAGAVLGTIGYMAPEQASGELDVDARADVFALGCVLFECIAGRPAFSGSHDVAVLAKVLRDQPPRLRDLRPELPAELDDLITLLLAKDRARRPRDAGEVLALLSSIPAATGAAPARQATMLELVSSDSEQRISSVILGRPRNTQRPTVVDSATQEMDAHGSSVREQNLGNLDELSRRFGVESIPLQGGALLQIFSVPAPVTAVDQAMQAARCALRLRQLRPELKLGIATGGVDTTSSLPVGVAVDRAAMLLAQTGPDDVIRLDPLTAALLGARFDVRRVDDGLCLFGELEEWETPGVVMGKSTPFVGRAKELALLTATLQECIEEQSARAVLVVAPPGTGKSRLGREFLQHARTQTSARILVSRADPTSAGSALSLIHRLVRNAASLRAGFSAEDQRSRLKAYLRVLIPGDQHEQVFDFLAELVGIGSSRQRSALLRAARSDPEVMREQKRRAFMLWITAEAARGPLVLLAEDLHWGDLSSLAYIQQALSALASQPVLVLALARPEVYLQFPKLREFSNLDELRLRPLPPRAAEQLARALLGPPSEGAMLERILKLAEGNAFYLEELARWSADGNSQLPETVVAMVQSRLERLPSEARRVLRAASVFGETAWKGGVEAVLGPRSDAGPLLSWLCEQEVIEERRDARFSDEREFLFRHAFLREAAYSMFTDTDRHAAHRRAGAWLEERDERDALLLADHFERGQDVARALPWVVKAASAALDGGDFEGATQLARRGVGLGANGASLGMLLLTRSFAAIWSVDGDLDLPAEALALLPRGSGPWWLALSLHVFGSSMRGSAELATPYMELALQTTPGAELTSAYGQAIQTLAAGCALVGRAEIGWSLVQHLELAPHDSGPIPDLAFDAWLNLTRCILTSNSLRGEYWELGHALVRGRSSIEAMRTLGSASGEAAALFHVGNACCLLGSYEEAQAYLQQALKRALQTRNVLVEQHARLLLAVFALRGGTREQALATVAGLTTSGNSNIAHSARVVLAETLLREGRVEQALAAARAETAGPALLARRLARGVEARACLELGRYADALAAADRALADGGPGAFPQCYVDLVSSRAEALIALGDLPEAQKAITAARRFRARTARDIADPTLRATFVKRGVANQRLDKLADL